MGYLYHLYHLDENFNHIVPSQLERPTPGHGGHTTTNLGTVVENNTDFQALEALKTKFSAELAVPIMTTITITKKYTSTTRRTYYTKVLTT